MKWGPELRHVHVLLGWCSFPAQPPWTPTKQERGCEPKFIIWTSSSFPNSLFNSYRYDLRLAYLVECVMITCLKTVATDDECYPGQVVVLCDSQLPVYLHGVLEQQQPFIKKNGACAISQQAKNFLDGFAKHLLWRRGFLSWLGFFFWYH